MSWQLEEAEQRFSELVRRVLEEGPQVITKQGEEIVVVISAEEYRRMTGSGGEEKMDFKEFLMSAPEGLERIIPERSKELPRDVKL